MRHHPKLLLLLGLASLPGLAPAAWAQAPAQPATSPAPAAASPAAPASGAATVPAIDLQVFLDRAALSPGIIDGKPGGNTAKALKAFQTAHNLPPSGEVDAATWRNLQAAAGGEPALTAYTLSAEDLAGPFARAIPEDMEEKAKLPALGYTSPLERLSERFHATPELLQKLNPRARFQAAGERLRVPNVRPPAPEENSGDASAAQGVQVVVSKSASTLTVEHGTDVLFFAPITAGSEHDPLPIGDWKVKGVARNPEFHYNPDLFWDAEPGHSKAKLAAGPNNPVGVVWIDIDKEHYGLHGTPEPRLVGKTTSHGCVRLTNWDAMTVAALVRPGTPVLFRP